MNAFMQQATVLTHVRLNNGQQGIKALKSRMIDSTYVNAADPNSMRDLGQTRNAEYKWGVFKQQSTGYSDSKRIPINKKDNGGYSFGSTQKM